MKKSSKLLSVILAIIMIFSTMSVMAFATKTEYQSSDNLTALGAYSPDGAVTRLTTEERTSILFDYLDNVLAVANINLGQVVSISDLKITIDARSVDAICGTVDSVKTALKSSMFVFAKPLLGVVKNVKLSTWTAGMTRANNDQLDIINGLVKIINENSSIISGIISSGKLDVGVVGNFVDLNGVNKVLSDIPGLIKGLFFPLFNRVDDSTSLCESRLTNAAGAGKVEDTLDEVVVNALTKPQKFVSYKTDANNKCINNIELPTAANSGTRNYYILSDDETYFNCYYYDTDSLSSTYKQHIIQVDDSGAAVKYVKTAEKDADGSIVDYVWQTADGENLKYYVKDSYWLPSLKAAIDGGLDISLKTHSIAQLAYTIVPYVFKDLAPVVLNGSVKKLVAGWFGVSFTSVGDIHSAEVKALADYSSSDTSIFAKPQGAYTFEWSDYEVVNGTPYYRFQDELFKGDTSNANPYYNIINWDFDIAPSFIDDYVPTVGTDGTTATVTPSTAGYNTLLQATNSFLYKAFQTVLTPAAFASIGWVNGDNTNLVANARKAVQTIAAISPEYIFSTGYDKGYYDLVVNPASTNQEILLGIVASIIKPIMPQMILPSAANLKGQSILALVACMVRELATQFVPGYDYDALIYSNYNNKTLVAGKDNSYWLDVCVTMGVDIGASYLSNLADLGRDTDDGLKLATTKKYDLATFEANPQAWENTIDWVIDWALSSNAEWSWRFEKLIDCGETVSMNTAEDPWVKLDTVLNKLLPLKQIVNASATEGKTWLESVLRDGIILNLVNLNVTPILGVNGTTGLVNIPMDSTLRKSQDCYTAAIAVVRNILNGALSKATGDAEFMSASTFATLDSVFNQGNLATLVGKLCTELLTAYNNGLLDVVMPFLNFFVGWTTDSQKLANPNFIFENSAGKSYIYTGESATETIKILNSSSGMLLKHGSVYEAPYTMVIDNIECSGGSVDVTSGPVLPGATFKTTYQPNGATGPITVTVTYHYMFKDGTSAVGGTQQSTAFQYVTSDVSDFPTSKDDQFLSKNLFGTIMVNLHGQYQKDYLATSKAQIADVVDNLSMNLVNQVSDTTYKMTECTYSNYDANYVADSGDCAAKVNSTVAASGTIAVRPAKYNTAADLTNFASGSSFNLGQMKVTWKHSSKNYSAGGTMYYGSLYYANMSDLQKAYNDSVKAGYQRSWFKTDEATNAVWNEYVEAMKDAGNYIIAPMNTSTFAAKYTDEALNACTKRLQNAITALLKTKTSVDSYTDITTAIENAEAKNVVKDTDADINYQDYNLYEYFAYQNARTAGRNTVNAYKAPEAPQNYIDGSGLKQTEIEAVVANAGAYATAINSTVKTPSSEAMNSYTEALAAFKAPTYTDLEIADYAQKVTYYSNFLQPKAANLTFIQREVAAAEAQGYVAANYTATSWANYTKALADAKAITSASAPSEAFAAKYGLMVAEKNLMLKDNSSIENGAYTELNALIAQAKSIFTDSAAYTFNADKADGMTETEARANLIKTLGYEYTDAKTEKTVNLYGGSAESYVASDRYYSPVVAAYTDKVLTNLKAAMAPFASKYVAKPTESGAQEGVTVDSAVANLITGVTPGTLKAASDVLSRVTASDTTNTTLTATANSQGLYGTGATAVLSLKSGAPIATYTVVIYGDVNGDGAVDAFDASTVDLAINNKASLIGAYKTAGGLATGNIDLANYGLIVDAAFGGAKIAQ